ncbi:MAG: TSUP family transporter [Acidimicrobiales bacterium]|nr:TSUP family transporter [Acidimicrobiales bacterium]
MDPGDIVLLVAGGLAAGVVNTLAGGGSLLTVPLLVLAGVPGNVANGSNRVGILASNASAAAAFRRLGVSGLSRTLPVLVPVAVGSLVGALLVARLADETFERVFGVLMVPLLLLSLRPPVLKSVEGRVWSGPFTLLVFLAVGLYGGAFQAGIGLLLMVALSRSGMDLVVVNSVKVVVIVVVTVIALPLFIVSGRVDWGPALVLAAGFALGGALGARLTVTRGSSLIRPVMVAAVLALAGRLLGLF